MGENTFEIPKSVQDYFGNEAVREGVDELVKKLDGKKMPELDWDATRQYNQALLMAALVRADYVEMLFRIWEATFGEAGARDKLNSESSGCIKNINEVWEDDYVELDFYKNGAPNGVKDKKPSDGLLVSAEDDRVELQLWRYKNDDDIAEFGAAGNVEGWEPDDDDEYLKTSYSVSMTEFIEKPDKPDAALAEWRKPVRDMIAVLAREHRR